MFIMDIGDEKTYAFRREFSEKYGEAPSLIAAYAYDAVHVAAEAVRRAETEGKGHIRSDRRKVRDALKAFNSYDTAIKGVTGLLWFDDYGSVLKVPAMGIYKKTETMALVYSIPEGRC